MAAFLLYLPSSAKAFKRWCRQRHLRMTPKNTPHTMFRKILIVFENQSICPEALTYGRQLAQRMDAGVAFVMLAPMRFAGRLPLEADRHALNRLEIQAAQMLNTSTAEFVAAGIEVSAAFRVGEPPQELLKYLADHEPFQAIIWGSSPDLPAKGHWIWKTASAMECPLLGVHKSHQRGDQ